MRVRVCMCTSACVCVCVCVYVCQSIPLFYPEISIIPVQLSLKIIFLKYKQDKSIVNTSLFQFFEIGEATSPPLPKFWCLRNSKRNM